MSRVDWQAVALNRSVASSNCSLAKVFKQVEYYPSNYNSGIRILFFKHEDNLSGSPIKIRFTDLLIQLYYLKAVSLSGQILFFQIYFPVFPIMCQIYIINL